MEQQKRGNPRKGKWSAVDTVIILLIVLAIAGLVYRVVMTVSEKQHEEAGAMYEVYFEVDGIHRNTMEDVEGFDTVYLYENDARLGYIGVYESAVSGEYITAFSPKEGNEGKIHDLSAQGCMICSDAEMSGGGLLVGGSGYYLTVGDEVTVRTDRMMMVMKIVKIQPHD